MIAIDQDEIRGHMAPKTLNAQKAFHLLQEILSGPHVTPLTTGSETPSLQYHTWRSQEVSKWFSKWVSKWVIVISYNLLI